MKYTQSYNLIKVNKAKPENEIFGNGIKATHAKTNSKSIDSNNGHTFDLTNPMLESKIYRNNSTQNIPDIKTSRNQIADKLVNRYAPRLVFLQNDRPNLSDLDKVLSEEVGHRDFKSRPEDLKYNFPWHQDVQNPKKALLNNIILKNETTRPDNQDTNDIYNDIQKKLKEKTDEINSLQQKLQKKDELIAKYQENQTLNHESPSIVYKDEVINQIYKAQHDKAQAINKIKYNSMSLDSQVRRKHQIKQLELDQKAKEQTKRLELLEIMKQEQLKLKQDKYLQAKEYREHLELQATIRNTIKHQQSSYSNTNLLSKQSLEGKSQVPGPFMSPEVLNFQRYTKKNPKVTYYNPITGNFKAVPKHFYDSYPLRLSQSIPDPSLSASQAKASLSIPDTGRNTSEKFLDAKFSLKTEPKPESLYKPSEKNLSDYGSLIVQSSKLN